MRRTLAPLAALAILLATGSACAHPTPPDQPFPTTAGPAKPTTKAPATTGSGGTTGGTDQTATVCSQAIALSNSKAIDIRAQAASAQASVAAGDQSSAIATVLALKQSANDWAGQLNGFANQPVRPEVKAALIDGANKITTLAASTSVPTDADAQLTQFTNELAAACA